VHAEVGSPQSFKLLMLLVFSLQIKTIKVSNVSLGASEQDLKEFFSFSGDIEYVEMKRSVSCCAW
jgi:RNA recognition motif-containing protein